MGNSPSPRASTLAEPTPRERWVIGFVSTFLFCLCVHTLATIGHFSFARPTDEWQRRLIGTVFIFLLSEMCVAFAVFCGICLIWACARPPWLLRLLRFVTGHVWHVLLFFFFGSAVLAASVYLVTWLLGT